MTGRAVALTTSEIIEATGGSLSRPGAEAFVGVSIDSRTIREGELFVALRGERLDGHEFVAAALTRGAGALVSRHWLQAACDGGEKGGAGSGDLPQGRAVIAVEDTLKALHDLARWRRRGFAGPVLAVVGSNGKTTTKELTAAIIGRTGGVIKTAGNLNNHIGMPLSVVRGDSDARAMVLEMGTNRPGDVSLLCGIARPDTAVITNIGFEHLEGFGTLEVVRDSELEILPFVKTVVANADDAFLMEGIGRSFRDRLVTFGIESPEATVRARDIAYHPGGTSFTVCFDGSSVAVNSRLFGRFNVYNSLAAAAAALTLGTDLRDVREGIESFEGYQMRFEVRRCGAATFLNDVYNANPSSMEQSLGEFVRLREAWQHRRGVVVLGDMLELGDHAVPAHRHLGRLISGLPVDVFIGVGPLMALSVAESGGKGVCEATSEAAGRRLAEFLEAGDIVLIKGSRGMRMERVLETLEKEGAASGPSPGCHEGRS